MRIHSIISEKEIVNSLPLFLSPSFYALDREAKERRLTMFIASVQERLELERLGLRKDRP